MKLQQNFTTLSNIQMIQKAIEYIKKNGVLLMPTDTVYGLSGRAFSIDAFQKINIIKQRPKHKRLILLVANFEMLQNYVSVSPFVLQKLKAIQTPTTVIYTKTKQLPAHLLADDGTIAIRVVKGVEWLQQFISKVGEPILSTSANISGQKMPLSFNEIDEKILNQVDFVLTGEEKNTLVKSSQIIRFKDNNEIIYIRK